MGKSETSALLYWSLYCLVNVARSSFEISLQRPLWWKVWIWLADKQKTQKMFFSHIAGSLYTSVCVAWRWLGVSTWNFIDIFVRVLRWTGGHPTCMLCIAASDCISVPGLWQGNFQCLRVSSFLLHFNACAFTCAFSFNVLHALSVFGPVWGVFLVPGFGVVSSSPQVPRHPTSKCDSDVNCLAH